MNRVKVISWILLILSLSFNSMGQTGASVKPDILVGAIRWDAWYKVKNGIAKNNVPKLVEGNLSKKAYHFRVPFFAQLDQDSVILPTITQELIDQEILLARDAGIDYWAYCWYKMDGSSLSYARQLHQSSKYRNEVKMCAMIENAHFTTEKDLADLIKAFSQDNYQKVAGDRPLVYFFDAQSMTAETIRKIREAARAQGMADPYIAMMGHSDPCKGAVETGCDAVSRYVTLAFHEDTYEQLNKIECDSWNVFRDKGQQVIPIVTAGWDPRPRIHREPWGHFYCDSCWAETATAKQVADHLGEALDWIDANSNACPANALLIYAWNEYDEGGWIAPTMKDIHQGKLVPERLNAIAGILKTHRHKKHLE
ncbi:MAG TPA: glycoside hydrolase family 99-like domain-containing protein [Prolixibacteraceae bacterium]|jgi:hypothetical protein